LQCAQNISSDEDLGSLHDSLKGLTADENFNVLRQYDEDIVDDEEDNESDESDEEDQIKSQTGKFNLSKKGMSLVLPPKSMQIFTFFMFSSKKTREESKKETRTSEVSC